MIPLVLLVSRDQTLLLTRQLILGAFFQVKDAGRVREAEELISQFRFDLVVLCYTLPEHECRSVIKMISAQKQRPKVLMLCAAGCQPEQCRPDQAVMIEAGPYYLLKKSAELLGVDIKAKANLVGV